MGGQGSTVKKTYNANQTNEQMQNQLLNQTVRDAFHTVAINGTITKDKFNQALAILQGFEFKRLRDTPLADRLFSLFDRSNVGHLSEVQLTKGINQILSDKNNAITYTFKAYDKDEDNRITKKQYCQFIEESWIAAFRILGDQMQSQGKNFGIKIMDIQFWSKSKISALNQQSAKIFDKYDTAKKGVLQFPSFRQLIINSGCNDITVSLDTFSKVIPLNLVNLK